MEKTISEIDLLYFKAQKIREWKIEDNFIGHIKALAQAFGEGNDEV